MKHEMQKERITNRQQLLLQGLLWFQAPSAEESFRRRRRRQVVLSLSLSRSSHFASFDASMLGFGTDFYYTLMSSRVMLRQSVVRTDSGCDSRERVLAVVALEQTSSRPPSSSSSCDHVFTSSREAVLEELLLLLIHC